MIGQKCRLRPLSPQKVSINNLYIHKRYSFKHDLFSATIPQVKPFCLIINHSARQPTHVEDRLESLIYVGYSAHSIKRFNCSQRISSRPALLVASQSQPRSPIPSRDKVLEHQRLPRSRRSSSLSSTCGSQIQSPQLWAGERLRSRPSRMTGTALCKSTFCPYYAQTIDLPHLQHWSPF